ncbi:MAG TPA: response regulator transcription factor [Usitatibacter sp.]|jgi:DNA-binding NarL/FixJ family response regulator|nr:response regulator transcription factor [Usitatibacter sp.]
MATVMVVEDDPAFLKRFCGIIASDPDLELFAAVPDCASARQALHNAAPDVLLTDLGLPDGSGIDIIREASRRFPATDTVVITVFGDEQHVIAAIEAGATGYILKDSIPEQFVGLIKELRAGGSPISPVIARQLLKRFKSPPEAGGARAAEDAGLSARESEVLSLIAKGFSFAEIARLLGVSKHTVTTHVKKIYQKLAVHSRGEAVYEAGKMGLI